MLETYFVKPQTVDRIRACWIGPEIERYASWLSERGYSTRTMLRRVPVLVAFGEFARLRGALVLADLPAHVDEFVAMRVASFRRGRAAATEVRGGIEQMLAVVLPGFERIGRPRRELPFAWAVPGFFEYLAAERGLRPESIVGYRHHLACFEAYLGRIGVAGLAELSPAILSAFVAERAGAGLAKTTVRSGCGVLRVFLRYAHRQGLLAADLSKAVEWPTAYQLSGIPRSISWEQVGRVLGAVDRRTPCGKRDYAILLLLVTYGLRAREVAALMLDDIDWKRDRLAIPGRKAGHSTAFPLSAVAAEALVAYLRHGRPASTGRHVFFRAVAPVRPISRVAVSACAKHYLVKAGIQVPRPGRTRCGTPASSGWWTTVSGSRRSGTSSGTARRPPRRSTPRSPSSRCARSHSATGSRCWHDRHRCLRGRAVHRAQAGTRPQVPQRGPRTGAAGALRRRARRQLPQRAHARPTGGLPSLPAQVTSAQLQSPARRRALPAGLGGHLGPAGGIPAAGPPPPGHRRPHPVPVRPRPGPPPAGCRGRTARQPAGSRPGPDLPRLFALCYGLGLRAGEACSLRLGDVDAGRSLLIVRGGKFGKSRLVPHRPRVAALVSEHAARRARTGVIDAQAPLFTFDGQRPIHPGTASQAFHHLVATLELPVPAGVSPPRLHDLRHSFAVGCLLRWYREGIDPSARLCQLSAFMGHVEPRSTSVYLTKPSQLLAEASRRFEAFAAPAWTQVT